MPIHATESEQIMQPVVNREAHTSSENSDVLSFTDHRPQTARIENHRINAQDSVPLQRAGWFQSLASGFSSEKGSRSDRSSGNGGLPNRLRRGIESLSGYFMGDVKVHYNSSKPATMQAHAYAQGTNIHLSPGGERYLPHEAWHVVQQKQGRVPTTRQLKGKININDNEQLEREADIMGARALQFKASTKTAENYTSDTYRSSTSGVVQRFVIDVDGLTLNHEVLLESDDLFDKATPDVKSMGALLNKIDDEQKLVGGLKNSSEIEQSVKLERLRKKINHKMTQAVFKQQFTTGKEWLEDKRTEGAFTLNKEDPMFTQIAMMCYQNHWENPYSTDALHETGPITSGWLSGSYLKMASGLFDKSFYMGKDKTDRPGFMITKIEVFKNPKHLQEYEKAKASMEQPNEKMLFSGHGPGGMEFISKQGHDPAYHESYDPRLKGHGAHGRGAYFTEVLDKAMSYSRAGQQDNEERSFFIQSVLLGKTKEYSERGKYRHSHHNEMVKADRSSRNKVIGPGVATPGLGDYDSLKGTKSYESGAGILGTFWHSKQFDSDEYMVRNADQIYLKFRVYYKLRN